MQVAFGDRLRLRPPRARAHGGRHGLLPRGDHAQPGGARARRGGAAARCWAVSAAAFLGWCLLPVIEDEARRIEVGFLGAAALLALLLARVYRERPGEGIGPDSPEEIEARLAAADEAA